MSKNKIKVSEIMQKFNLDFDTAKNILGEMGIEAKTRMKTIEEEHLQDFEKRLHELQKVGQVKEKEGVQEKVVKRGVKRRIIVKSEEEHPVEEVKEEQVPIPKVEKKVLKDQPVVAEQVKEGDKIISKDEKDVDDKADAKVEHKKEDVVKERYVAKGEVSISMEQKEKIEKELEQRVTAPVSETKVQKPVEFHKKDRQVAAKKPFSRPNKPPFRRDKFDKQVQERETTISPGKREIIMGPKEFRPDVPLEQKPGSRRSQDRRKDVLKKDQLLELKEREDKLNLQKKRKSDDVAEEKPVQKKPLKISEAITVGELAKRMGVKLAAVIKTLLDLGVMATINHLIDSDTAAIVASEFDYEVERVSIDSEELIAEEHLGASGEEKKISRSPVVTIMGHVDHGKTSLLDVIRKTNVVASEAGGITQHIGAYQVEIGRGTITFLDTPGHEAFTTMRARGAQATDIVILVVAADEGPMPQTIEALNHAKAANVPIIVAMNKIDKPGTNPEKIKNQLAERGLIPEEWGGHTVYAEVSAKKEIGIQELLDHILIQAEMLELKANPDKLAKGVVIESKLDKGRGPVATVLVQEGTLKVGDPFIVGTFYGKVRSLFNDKGKKIDKAGPSTPVEVLGFPGVPEAGEPFVVVSDERKARQIAGLRENKLKEKEMAKKAKLSLEDVYQKIQDGEIQELNIVLKSDVQGSAEAISESLNRISAANLRINIIHSGVGIINESDVMLAEASRAIIIGFNVKPDQKSQQLAEKNKVDIKTYNIIYDLIDNIKLAMEGLLKPVEIEVLVGKAEVRQTFSVPKVGIIAGSYATEGKITRNNKAKLLRDKNVIFEGKISSLKRFKDDVREVQQGFEFGISLDGFNDIKSGDIIEFYEIQQIAVKLEAIPEKE
jgi:translation initiation factor IF-2